MKFENFKYFFNKIYNEEDRVKNLTWFLTGMTGLLTYIAKKDIFIAGFFCLTVYPAFKEFLKVIEKIDRIYEKINLSDAELEIVKLFVDNGVLQINVNLLDNEKLTVLKSLEIKGYVKKIYYDFTIKQNVYNYVEKILKKNKIT